MSAATEALDALDALPRRIAEEVAEATAMPKLAAVRAALQEVGIRRARGNVTEAPSRIASAAADLRATQEAERTAKALLDAEVLAAEWELSARFVNEGNRWYLVDGEERRQMTADERARWTAAEAARQPTVVAAGAALRSAEHATAAARDALSTAERAFSAAKHDLTAAVAELQALGIGIASTPEGDHR